MVSGFLEHQNYVDGLIEITGQGNDLDVVDEQKVDQLVAELEKYRVDVAEVIWLWCA